MRPAGRLQAAIEILTLIFERPQPAAVALSEWGRSHRFAGSGDRAAIGNLVFDVLRNRQSLAWRMGGEEPRALALGALRYCWGEPADAIAAMCDGCAHAPEPLSADELNALREGRALDDAPPWVKGNYPEWLHDDWGETFGDAAAEAGEAFARRAPVDLRVNTLKATRERVLRSFAEVGAEPTPFSPIGVRIPPPDGPGRAPNVEASPAHGKGWIEVQDEGSQLAALLAGAAPRMQVADICAGAGGKTLAFAAAMQNTGQIFAYDSDPVRFRPIFDRLRRAGARNVQTLTPGKPEALAPLEGRMDLVLVDAPCSGTGVWRRRPDSKWQLTREQIEARVAAQRDILKTAARLVRPGGRLAYVTCSVLRAENEAQAKWFLGSHAEFAEDEPLRFAEEKGIALPPSAAVRGRPGYLMAPHTHGTDGFYFAAFRREGA